MISAPGDYTDEVLKIALYDSKDSQISVSYKIGRLKYSSCESQTTAFIICVLQRNAASY